jgi:hypothetical protein
MSDAVASVMGKTDCGCDLHGTGSKPMFSMGPAEENRMTPRAERIGAPDVALWIGRNEMEGSSTCKTRS